MKRDVEQKMDVLHQRTQRAIVDLISASCAVAPPFPPKCILLHPRRRAEERLEAEAAAEESA